MRHPLRVAILRSSRFLPETIDACRARWPGADLRVVYQPGSEAEWRSRGVAEDAALRYDEARFLRPWPFLQSKAARALWRWRPNVVVVQWVYPSGRGQQLVAWSALLVHPTCFEVLGADGTWTRHSPRTALAHAIRIHRVVERLLRRVPGLVLVPLVVLLSIATAPAWIAFRLRERLRLVTGAVGR